MNLNDLSPNCRQALQDYNFNEKDFRTLQKKLSEGEFPDQANVCRAPIAPPNGDFPHLDQVSKAALTRGTEAMQNAKVCALILNGGMATRFGGVVKGVVEVYDGLSFLALKIKDIRSKSPDAPIFLMNSFATDEETQKHINDLLEKEIIDGPIHYVHQNISLRLRPDGTLFPNKKDPSLYAPGHGDIFDALSRSLEFQSFKSAGGKAVIVSNVDNLGASFDPALLGFHLEHQAQATVEVAPKKPGDKGGAPAILNGRLAIVEGFRFPKDFDQDQISVFNTNTFTLDVQAIHAQHPLRWFRANKEANGEKVVQFERLMGEVTSFIETQFLEVSRIGKSSRFLPVKTPGDLDVLIPVLRERLSYLK